MRDVLIQPAGGTLPVPTGTGDVRLLVAGARSGAPRLALEVGPGWRARRPRSAPADGTQLEVSGVLAQSVTASQIPVWLALRLAGGEVTVTGLKLGGSNDGATGQTLLARHWTLPLDPKVAPVTVAAAERVPLGRNVLGYTLPTGSTLQESELVGTGSVEAVLALLPGDAPGTGAYGLVCTHRARFGTRISHPKQDPYWYFLAWPELRKQFPVYRSEWAGADGTPPKLTAAQFTWRRGTGYASGSALLGVAGLGVAEYWNQSLLEPYLAGSRQLNMLPRMVPVPPSELKEPTSGDARLGYWAVLFADPDGDGATGALRWRPEAVRVLTPGATRFLFARARVQNGELLEMDARLSPRLSTPPAPNESGVHATAEAAAGWLMDIAGEMARHPDPLVLEAAGAPARPAPATDDKPKAPGRPGLGRRVRLGAFDFDLADPAPGGPVPAITVRVSANSSAFPLPRTLNSTRLRADVEIPVAAVRPGGQDALVAGDLRRELDRGLVIPLPSAQYNSSDLSLKLSQDGPNASTGIGAELLNRGSSGELPATTAKYCLSDGTPAGGQVVVVDRQPLLVALVEFPSFIKPVQQDKHWQVARWNGSGWKYDVQSSGEACLVLPAQGWGEEMEREGTLRDRDDQPLDWRLGTPLRARFNLGRAPETFKQVPWDFERLFQDTLLPGTGEPDLKSLQFELLYGMPCTWEGQGNGWFVLADIERRLGRVPDEVPTLKWLGTRTHTKARTDAADRWVEQYRRYHSRALVLEPVRRDDLYSLDPVLLDSGMTCRLLKPEEADTRHPVTPAPGDSTSLRGGALFGIESANVYTAITSAPNGQSSAATLSEGAFTSLGGYGLLDATFRNSRIISRVDMGRVSEYAVERKGRIAVFWNRAKHVIVYQRTVAPSEQFGAFQTPLGGRAVIRKVHEYIEIEEESRRFLSAGGTRGAGAPPLADGGKTADPLDPGFVTGCHFPRGTRINVRSAWGGDVGALGWQVPLWNPAAAARQPTVYPRPDIALSVVGGGRALVRGSGEDVKKEQAAADVPCTLLEPENVYFFTYTADENQAVEDWPAVEGVDFVDLQPPVPPGRGEGRTPGEATAAPEEAPVPPGFERFTFRVRQGDERTNLVAGRVTGSPAEPRSTDARIESVSLQRGPRVSANAPTAAMKSLASIPGMLDQAHAAALELLPLVGDEAPARTLQQWLASATPPPLQGVLGEQARAAHKRYRDALATLDAAPAEVLRQRLKRGAEIREAQVESVVRDVAARLTGERGPYKDVLDDLRTGAGELLQPIGRVLGDPLATEQEKRARLRAHLRVVADEVMDRFRFVPATPEPVLQAQVQALNAGRELMRAWVSESAALEADANGQVAGRLEGWVALWRERLDGVDRQLASARAPWLVFAPTLAAVVLRPFRDALDAVEKGVRAGDADGVAAARAAIAGLETGWTATAHRWVTQLCPSAAPPAAEPDPVRRLLACGEVARRVESIHAALLGRLPREGQPLPDADTLARALNDELQAQILSFEQALPALRKELVKRAWGDAERFRKALEPEEARLRAAVDQARNGVEAMLAQVAGEGQAARRKIEEAVAGLRADAAERARTFAQQAARDLAPLANLARPALEERQRALRLVRAFGEAPKLGKLNFSRERVGYYFQDPRGILQDVGVTPVVAQLDRVGAELKAMGLDLPIEGLSERLIPALDLSRFDLSSVFRDFAGLRLDALLGGLKVPDEARKYLSVRHETDARARRMSVKATLRKSQDEGIEIAQRTTLFSMGPLEVGLEGARFSADASFSASLGSSEVERTMEGRIQADWIVRIGGTPMITFQNTALSFRSPGSLKFDVDPKRIRLNPSLEFLTNLMSNLGGKVGGLTVAVTPGGVESVLDTALPPLQTGTFAITNLHLGARFGLEFGDTFAISVGAFLGRRDAPFALTIFVLGGGGYLDVRSRYEVSSGRLTARVGMAINANATVGVALGPIRGSVFVALGFTAEFAVGGAAEARGLRVGVLFLLRGEVSVLGIVDVMLVLELAASYDPSGRIRGTGRISLRIKICWCYTLKVKRQIDYTLGCDADRFAPGHRAALLGADALRDLALDYVSLLD